MAHSMDTTAENTTDLKLTELTTSLVPNEPPTTEMSLVDIVGEGPTAAEEQLAPVDWPAGGLVWLTGSVLAAAFLNNRLSNAAEFYRHEILEKDPHSTSVQAVDSVSTIGYAGLFGGLACCTAVGYIWAFHKAKRGGCLSKSLFRCGMATTVCSLVLMLICYAVMVCVFYATK